MSGIPEKTINPESQRSFVDARTTTSKAQELQAAEKGETVLAEPQMEVRLFNINSSIALTALTKSFETTLEKLYMGFARQVQDGIISIKSIHASTYSFTIVVELKVSRDEYMNAWKNMYAPRAQWLFAEDEWERWFEFSDPSYVELKQRFLEKTRDSDSSIGEIQKSGNSG